MIEYAPLQQKWLKHHYLKWQREYGWSASEFAARVKQPRDALAEVLGLSLEDFGPPPEARPPVCAAPSSVRHHFTDTAPAALPDPESATVIIEPGVELMPREKPPVPAAPPPRPPYRRRAWVLLTPGKHIINGLEVDIRPPSDNPGATLVDYEVNPDEHYVIDGRNAVIQRTSMLQIHP
jgi:hypothetical protein